MPDLRRELELLAADVEFPATPYFGRVVAEPGAARRRPRRFVVGRPVLVALLLLLLAAATVFAAVPSVRHAVLELFDLQGATVERRAVLPPPVAPGPRLGRRVTLAEASRAVSFPVLVPARLRAPDAVYVHGPEVLLSYAREPRLLLSEFRGDLDPDYTGKIAAMSTRVERLRVGGWRAVWIAGAPHDFFYRDANGRQRFDTLRLAGNVLLVERGRLLVRLEGAFGMREAVTVAASLR